MTRTANHAARGPIMDGARRPPRCSCALLVTGCGEPPLGHGLRPPRPDHLAVEPTPQPATPGPVDAQLAHLPLRDLTRMDARRQGAFERHPFALAPERRFGSASGGEATSGAAIRRPTGRPVSPRSSVNPLRHAAAARARPVPSSAERAARYRPPGEPATETHAARPVAVRPARRSWQRAATATRARRRSAVPSLTSVRRGGRASSPPARPPARPHLRDCRRATP